MTGLQHKRICLKKKIQCLSENLKERLHVRYENVKKSLQVLFAPNVDILSETFTSQE